MKGTRPCSRCFSLELVLLIAAVSALAQGDHASSGRAEFTRKLVTAAFERTHHIVRYEPAYVHIPYPGGDVPADTGVCIDEIIRIYRAVGVDLQKKFTKTYK